MTLGQVSVTNKETPSNFDLGMHKRGQPIKGDWRFKVVAVVSASTRYQGIALIRFEDDRLKKIDIAKCTVELRLISLRYHDLRNLGGAGAVQLCEADGMGGLQATPFAVGIGLTRLVTLASCSHGTGRTNGSVSLVIVP